jgi:membrane protease YdiL (CAAX protease family)
VRYPPFRANDAAFAASLSLNAAVGEEALFRGWLLPMLTQKLGGRFWLANVLQAGLFGLGHPQAGPFAVVIGGGAAYSGWLTRRNGWSVREAIFQHFWYDVAVVTASLLRDDRGVITLAPITIRF